MPADLSYQTIHMKGQVYYNPADFPIYSGYGGEEYVFRPGIGELVPKIAGHSPRDLYIHLFGEDGRSGKVSASGVRPLLGDASDSDVMAEADAAFSEGYITHCLSLKIAHMSRVAKEKEASLPISPPDKATMRAMEFLAKRQSQTAQFQCSECGWPCSTEFDLQVHGVNFHSDIETDQEQPQPKRRGRPPGKKAQAG